MMTQWPILVRAVEGDGWFCGYDAVEMLPERQSVRAVPETAFDQFLNRRNAFESTFGQIPERASRQLIAMSRIARAAKARELGKVAKLAWEAIWSDKPALDDDLLPSQARPRYRAASSAVRAPLDLVGAILNGGVGAGSIKPVLWQRESRRESHLMPALLCSDAAQALFIHALFRVSYKWGLKICQHCKALFSSTHGQRDCCSRRCSMAENSKRYRRGIKAKRSRRQSA